MLANFGFDVEISPRLRSINNANLLWFDSLNPLQQFTYQLNMNRFIGVDLSSGLEYRPLLSNNVIFRAGVAALLPGQGFRDLFDTLENPARPLLAGFVEAILAF
jgi:hypothetical protein